MTSTTTTGTGRRARAPTAVGTAHLGAGSGSVAPRDFPVQRHADEGRRTLEGFPETVPEGVVLEFPGGERVWRTADGTDRDREQARPGAGPGRVRARAPGAGAVRRPRLQEGAVRARPQPGPGHRLRVPLRDPAHSRRSTNACSAGGSGIPLPAPRRESRAGFPLVTNTRSVEGSTRLAEDRVPDDVSSEGERRRLFEFGILVEGTIGEPDVKLVDPKVWTSSSSIGSASTCPTSTPASRRSTSPRWIRMSPKA